MTGPLAAFAWLRWRLFVNGLRGRKRDSFEQVSRITRLLVIAIVAVSLVPGSIVLAALAFAGGRGLAHGNENATGLMVGARAVLAIVTIVVAMSPLLRFGGAATSMIRLALLPVPRGVLFTTELAAHLADPWLLALLPALVALPAGLLAGDAAGAAAWVLAAGVMVLALLAALSGTASLLGALLFRNRRLGELASVGLLIGITVLAYLPVLNSHGALLDRPGSKGAQRRPSIANVSAFDARVHPWLAAAPWEMYARAVEVAIPPRRGAPLGWLAALAINALALMAIARGSFGRLLDTPADRRAKVKRGGDRMRRIPGLSPAASAVARALIRLVTRSVRGRVILFTAPLPAFLFAFLWRGRSMGFVSSAYTGVLVLGVATSLAMLSLSTVMCDQFAVDRAGLSLTFLVPASGRDIVAGKAVGALGVFLIPLGIGSVAAIAIHPRGSPFVWVGALVCAIAAFILQTPLAAALAAWFPAPFDMSRLKAGNAHPLASILAALAALAGWAGCGGVLAITLALTRSPVLGCVASFVVLTIAVGIARVGWTLAARALDARRENLALIAQGR